MIPTQSQGALRRRVVIGFASTGCGHFYAARAVAERIRELDSGAVVSFVNVLGDETSCIRTGIEFGWRALSKYDGLRSLYGLVYRLALSSDRLSAVLSYISRTLAGRKVVDASAPVDEFIAVHSAAVAYGASMKSKTGCRLTVVATDYVFHSLHCNEAVDEYYIPPSSVVLGGLPKQALQEGKVTTRAIPSDPAFLRARRSERRSRQEPFCVLVSFGATGLRGLENLDMLRRLLSAASADMKFVLVAGNDQGLRKAFRRLRRLCPWPQNVQVHGLVGNMADLMMRAHLLVGKAGGLTVCEAIRIGLPLAIVDSLPGQEAFNVEMVLRSGRGKRLKNASELLAFVNDLHSPSTWSKWSLGHSEDQRLLGASRHPRLLVGRPGY